MKTGCGRGTVNIRLIKYLAVENVQTPARLIVERNEFRNMGSGGCVSESKGRRGVGKGGAK